VAQGLLPGHTTLRKFGYNGDIDTGDVPTDIWDAGGLYPWSTSADIVSASSSNAGDDQVISIQGLNAAGAVISQNVTLNGRTRVALTTPMLRVWRMKNEGATVNAGDVYVFSGTAVTDGVPSGASVVKAKMLVGNGQTLMAVYTIPLGKVGFLRRLEVGLGNDTKQGYVTCHYWTRPYGGVFQVKKAFPLNCTGTTLHADERMFPDPIPALSDIRVSAQDATDNNNEVSATFDIVLIDEAQLTDAFLATITQPSSV